MSETSVSAVGEPTITLADPSSAKPSAPAPAPAGESTADGKSEWAGIGSRLEQQKRSILKDLGVESIEVAKAALEKLAKQEDAEKSTAQRAAELETSLKSTRAEKDAMAAALGAYAKGEMGKLTDIQRAAVAGFAGDDPAKQLSMIEALRPTWAGAAAPAAQAQTAKVADTAPGRTAPKDGGGDTSPPDLKAIHAEMQKTNPVVAARFAIENRLFETK